MPSAQINQILLQTLQKNELSALLITDLISIRYFSGFTGTNATLFITNRGQYLITDFRYLEQARAQSKNYTILNQTTGISSVKKRLTGFSSPRLGFQSQNVSYAWWANFKKELQGIQLVPITSDPALWRIHKTALEIKELDTALSINHIAFKKTISTIRPGLTEKTVRQTLEKNLLTAGAERIGFDTIIASGWRGALPHGVASDKKIKRGEMVTIDFGGVYNGYHADETYTVVVGPPTMRQKEVFATVRDAQQIALNAVRPGIQARELDRLARAHITKKGFGRYFGHALGHGVGLEVHERPVLAEKSPDTIEAGMVFTIEPGIYIPNWGGVRLEDVVVCTNNGPKLLSKTKKILLQI